MIEADARQRAQKASSHGMKTAAHLSLDAVKGFREDAVSAGLNFPSSKPSRRRVNQGKPIPSNRGFRSHRTRAYSRPFDSRF